MKEVDFIDYNRLMPDQKHTFKLNMVKNAMGDYWQVPVMVAKGKEPGPVLGVTAALHGNELNGIPIIHQIWKKLDECELKGTLVCVPVLNVSGFLNGEREFHTGKDLNRIMPGKEHGNTSEVYAHMILDKIVRHLDFLIDIHTASFGRINSLYVRADLSDEKVATIAKLHEPQIIVSKPGGAGTLRAEATKMGIPAITVEVGDPHIFQRKHIRPSIFGLNNVLAHLGMIDEEEAEVHQEETVICEASYWVYAENGGILRVRPGLTEKVLAGEQVATITDIYGEVIEEIRAPEDAVVVAKSTNPVCQVGSRVIHLGIVKESVAAGKNG